MLRPAILLLPLFAAGCVTIVTIEPTATRSTYLPAVNLPDGALGLYVEGELARRGGDDERAILLLAEAVRLNDAMVLPNRSLTQLHAEAGDVEEAIFYAERLVERDAASADSHRLLGDVLAMAERASEALQSYLAALRIDPDDAAAQVGAGRSLVKLERHDEAIDYLDRGLIVQDDDGLGWVALGQARAAIGDTQAAEAAFARAVEALPADDPIYYDLLLDRGTNLSRLGRHAAAADALQLAASRRPDDARPRKLAGDALARAGADARREGDLARARQLYRNALQQYDDALVVAEDAAVLAASGSTLIRLWDLSGRIDDDLRGEAVSRWEKSLELDSDQPEVQAAIGRFRDAGILR
jgi:tetratricopeptide (TPR) repeat protein